jgi:hypothetical protein
MYQSFRHEVDTHVL